MSKSSRSSRQKGIRDRKSGWAAYGPLATVVIVAAGIVALVLVGGQLGSTDSAITPVATAVPSPAARATAVATASPVLSSSEVAQRNNLYNEPPPVVIRPDRFYQAIVQTTKGDFNLQLFHREASHAVNSFVFLSNEGFYRDMPFWAVTPGEVVITGDPLANGTGGPGYELPVEISDWKHIKPGMVALGRFPNSSQASGSQFYITLAAKPEFDGRYPIFGQVIFGMEVVERLEVGDLIKDVLIVELEPPQLATVTPAPE